MGLLKHMTGRVLTADLIRRAAYDLGFDLCRIVAARPEHVHAEYVRRWLEAGCHGDMDYLARGHRTRTHPETLTDSSGRPIRSVVVLGIDYYQEELPAHILNDPARGVIARYAWQEDYHEVLKPMVFALDTEIRRISGRAARARGWVDTGPIVERDWAMAAGMTFTGKNCCAIHPQRGSWLLLAVLCIPEHGVADPPPRRRGFVTVAPEEVIQGLDARTDLGAWELRLEDDSTDIGACGRCTRCLEACPTDAFRGPLMLDARKCISYWTIEARGAAPRELRRLFGNRIFGCDICQEVCPWNRDLGTRRNRVPGLDAKNAWMAPHLLEGFSPDTPYWISDDAFRQRFRRSPVKRAKRSGMLRNVCTALGNWGSAETASSLKLAMRDSSAPVRQHAAWALGQVWAATASSEVRDILKTCRQRETDGRVQSELDSSLALHL